MRRLLAVFLMIFVLAGSVVCKAETRIASECDISDLEVPLSQSVETSAVGTVLEIKAKSAVLLEPFTGKVLYDQNGDEKLPPASITKVMSL